MTDFARLYEASQQLLVFQDVLEDEIGQAFGELLGHLAISTPTPGHSHQITVSYIRLFRLLSQEATAYQDDTIGDAWQNHLLDRLLDSDNVLARRMRTNPVMLQPDDHLPNLIGSSLHQAAVLDIATLQNLYRLGSATLVGPVRSQSGKTDLPAWLDLQGQPRPTSGKNSPRYLLKRDLHSQASWPTMLGPLLDYYRQYDSSDFSRHGALRWVRTDQGGHFEPILHPDEQRLENLVGYERERGLVIANTEQFLAGLGANNVLLYGARGTGKSSTVKALLPRYFERGLRLIEVHKGELGDFPLIARTVRGRPEKFILFVDDLSFEAEEISYKDLKALLEGSLEARPANLLIYATSNRRHLIKEQFGDNAAPGDDEVNAWDTVEEKLSLSDRFGLTITFLTPNQQQYLAIVDGLAKQAGITMEPEELHRRALRWELGHSGRSGRTARQFIDQLTGELRLKS